MESFQRFLLFAPVILLSMVAHEYAHAYAALKQGDDTAQRLGRVTWNPFKHIDPFMTVLMPLLTFFGSKGTFIFGGAKPVPVDPRNYRNYRSGDIIVSLAGIATNFVLAIGLVGVVALIGLAGRALPALSSTWFLLQVMGAYGIFINLLLAVFNLLPVPPLDGSHVVKHFLPPAWAIQYEKLQRAGFLIILLLVMFGGPIFDFWLQPVRILNASAADLLAPLLVDGPWMMWMGSWVR